MDNATLGWVVMATGVLMVIGGFIVFASSSNSSYRAITEMPRVPFKTLKKVIDNLHKAMKGYDFGMCLILGGFVVIVTGSWIFFTS